jgi:uncharacterized protein YukE
LQSADPATIAQWAAVTRSGAETAGAAGTRLAAMCAAMPVGVWRGAAAGVFVNAGHEQARRLAVVATLLEQLAAVAAELAAALAGAQAQARSAVARGSRLDVEVHALNDRFRAQHALRPQDPDSLLADGPEANDLQMRLASAAGELADAEAAAARAWQHAAARFDLVSYGSPAMRRRMVDASWDPSAEVRLAASAVAGVTTCGPMQDLGLPLGGVITGPDGRSYPLFVQTAIGEVGNRIVTTRDPVDAGGWNTLAVRVGSTEFGPKASAWEKVAVALGGAAGAAYPQGTSFVPGLLGAVQIMPGGGAYLTRQPRAEIDPVKEALAEAPRNHLEDYWVAPVTGLAAGRRAVVGDALGLLDNVLGGLATASHLDDGRAADYRVVFEEDAQGARRARLELFQVLNVPGEFPRVMTAGGYVDASGHLAGVAATGEAPGTPPIMIPAPG